MGTELEQLRERMEKRLARNRESARKSREKQKTHQAQLETQLQELKNEIQAELERAQNTSGLSAAVDGDPGANADGTGGSDQPPAELVERFSVWRMTLVQAIEKVRTSLSMGETEALAQQVAEAFEVVSSLATVWEEALRKKHYAVVFTAELFHPWERPFLWMGLLQPSDWLRLSVSKMEQGQMLQDQMKHTLETWAETFKQQEMQLSEALRQTGAQMSAVGMQAPLVPQEDQVPEVAMEQQRQMQGKLEEMVMIHRQALQLWQQAISLFRNSTAVQQAYHLLVFLEVFEGLNTVHSSLQGSARQPS